MAIDLNSPASAKNWDAVRLHLGDYRPDHLVYLGDGRFEAPETAFTDVTGEPTPDSCREATTYQSLDSGFHFIEDTKGPRTCLMLGSGRYGSFSHVRLQQERAVVKIVIWEIP